MSKITLRTPDFNELTYRKNLLLDPETMAYNKNFGGTIDFNESKWEDWFKKWISNNDHNYYYAYIIDNSLNIPVGEVAYRFDNESKTVNLNIILEAKRRGFGFGKEGLIELVKTAFNNGFNEVRDIIDIDNISSHKLFENIGFKCQGIIEGGKDYRLTKEEYNKLYGDK